MFCIGFVVWAVVSQAVVGNMELRRTPNTVLCEAVHTKLLGSSPQSCVLGVDLTVVDVGVGGIAVVGRVGIGGVEDGGVSLGVSLGLSLGLGISRALAIVAAVAVAIVGSRLSISRALAVVASHKTEENYEYK